MSFGVGTLVADDGSTVSRLESEVAELASDNAALESDRNDLSESLTKTQTALSDLQAETSEPRARFAAYEESIEALNAELASLQESVAAAETLAEQRLVDLSRVAGVICDNTKSLSSQDLTKAATLYSATTAIIPSYEDELIRSISAQPGCEETGPEMKAIAAREYTNFTLDFLLGL